MLPALLSCCSRYFHRFPGYYHATTMLLPYYFMLLHVTTSYSCYFTWHCITLCYYYHATIMVFTYHATIMLVLYSYHVMILLSCYDRPIMLWPCYTYSTTIILPIILQVDFYYFTWSHISSFYLPPYCGVQCISWYFLLYQTISTLISVCPS